MAKTIDQAMEHARDLVNDYHDQKELMEECDKMYFMDWDDKPTGREFKFTTSPSARNALLGAIRLMTSTEPKFVVPFDANRDDAKLQSEKIEKFCKTIWYHSGRFRGVPLEQPAIESLLRYGMMVLSITDTDDLAEIYEKRGSSKAQKRQIERLVNSTPYLIEAWDPKGVYPEFDRFGLSAVFRSVTMTLAQAKSHYGDESVANLLGGSYTDSQEVQYSDYWDLEKHMAWLSVNEGTDTIIAGEPIVDENHDLPCIPIVVQTSEGSYIDHERKYQALPFLYGAKQSGLWERQNLFLTYIYTNIFNMAANPTFIYTSVGDGELVKDYDTPGGEIQLKPGERYERLDKDVVNKDMMQGLSIADALFEESTIHKQALGGVGNIGANAAFSTVSLLNQVGRLPLTAPQKRGGWGIGYAMELIMEMLKDSKKARQLKTKDRGIITFDPKEIPDDLIIEGSLEVDLPQDQMSQANIAQLITQAGLASRRWAREKILNIGQSEEMDKEIWTDQASMQQFQMMMQKLQQAEMEQMMMQQQQAMAGRAAPQTAPNQQPAPRGPVSPGSAMQAQGGMIPAQRPGTRPVPSTGEGMPMQEGEMPL